MTYNKGRITGITTRDGMCFIDVAFDYAGWGFEINLPVDRDKIQNYRIHQKINLHTDEE